MARKINAVSPNESRLNGYFADPERRNTSNFRGISYEDERRAHANEIYESGTKWVNEQLQSGGGSGGGGGGADLLDENGIIKQEYFPKGFPYKSGEDNAVILPSTTLELDPDNGAFYIPNALEFVTGQEYVVKFENLGYEFTTVCQEMPENTDGAKWVLGDSGLLSGSATTGEPFAMIVMDPELAPQAGLGAMLMFLGDSTTLTVSIAGFKGTFNKIDNEYIETEPETVVVELIKSGMEWKYSHTPEQILTLARNHKPVQICYTENEYANSWMTFYLCSYGQNEVNFTNVVFAGDVTVYGIRVVDNSSPAIWFTLTSTIIATT